MDMVVSLMRRIFFETAIDGAALVANRYGRDDVIKNKINRRGDEQADEFGMITENHAEGKNEQAEARVEIFLQIKFVVSANGAALDDMGFCGGEVGQIHVARAAG